MGPSPLKRLLEPREACGKCRSEWIRQPRWQNSFSRDPHALDPLSFRSVLQAKGFPRHLPSQIDPSTIQSPLKRPRRHAGAHTCAACNTFIRTCAHARGRTRTGEHTLIAQDLCCWPPCCHTLSHSAPTFSHSPLSHSHSSASLLRSLLPYLFWLHMRTNLHVHDRQYA